MRELMVQQTFWKMRLRRSEDVYETPGTSPSAQCSNQGLIKFSDCICETSVGYGDSDRHTDRWSDQQLKPLPGALLGGAIPAQGTIG